MNILLSFLCLYCAGAFLPAPPLLQQRHQHPNHSQIFSSKDLTDEKKLEVAAKAELERIKLQTSRLLQNNKQQRNPQSPRQRDGNKIGKGANIASSPLSTDWQSLHPEEYSNLYDQYKNHSANSLKERLKELGLKRTGRKPDLIARIISHELKKKYPYDVLATTVETTSNDPGDESSSLVDDATTTPVTTFSTLPSPLPPPISHSLTKAGFRYPSPIQSTAIPAISSGKSVILHAETGSGKTLAYLLPALCRRASTTSSSNNSDDGTILILTPTRELACQVATVASDLGARVLLVTQPGNIARVGAAREERSGARAERFRGSGDNRGRAVVVVGSAKVVASSLFGEGKDEVAPTPRPVAKQFMMGVRYLVLDEVDRLLGIAPSRHQTSSSRRHEKPAAILTSTICRLSLSRTQIIAASATVGRPLRRELARVMELPFQESPPIIRPEGVTAQDTKRAVTIPTRVEHYVLPVKAASIGAAAGGSSGSTSIGALLTAAAAALQKMNSGLKILLVLTKGCSMEVGTVVGAFRHFGVDPPPVSLLDVMTSDDVEMDRWMENYQKMSGATGLGQKDTANAGSGASDGSNDGYLLITKEDSIRGLHLSDLDVVVVIGRSKGPDEYTHIAGRTGRAGKSGKVLNVVSEEQAAGLKGWETMLSCKFATVNTSKGVDLW